MSLVDDVADFLNSESTAFTLSSGTGNLAKQIALDSLSVPDTLAVVYETAGIGNEYTFSTSTGTVTISHERPSLQILSRSALYATARTQAETAYTILDGLAGRNLPTATGTRSSSLSLSRVSGRHSMRPSPLVRCAIASALAER